MAEGIVIGNLTIPVIKGDKGDKGNTGEIISISLVLLSPSSTAYAINNGSTTQAQIELGIPKGLSVSTTNINASGELVFTFNDNSTVNVGKVVGKGISEVTVTEDFDFVVTYTDGTSVTACNLEDEVLGTINDILESYYTKTEIDEMGFITKEVNNLTNYTLKTNTGSSIELSINNSTYVMTLNLKNSAGTTISTGTIDLPLETMVVGATYDNTNKKIVLTLKNGSTIDVPVADLVSGLQSEITSSNKLSADLVDDTSTTHKFTSTSEKSTWNAKYDKPSGGIPKSDLTSSVQTSLEKADTAVQDVSGKEDSSNKTGVLNSSSTTAQYPHAKAVYDELVERDEEINQLWNDHPNILDDNVLPSGTDLTLQGTGDLKMKVDVGGNSTQETTIGKNIFNVEDMLTAENWDSYANGKKINYTLKPNTQYTLSSNVPQSTENLLYFNGTSTATNGVYNGKTVTQTSDNEGNLYVGFFTNRSYYNEVLNGIYYVQLEEGSIATDFEEFTGGTASPNPTYKQDINNVEGDVEVKGKNRELFNGMFKLNYAIDVNRDYTRTNITDQYSYSQLNNKYYTFGGYFKAGTYTFSVNLKGFYISLNRVAIAGTNCVFVETHIRNSFTWTQEVDGYTYFSVERDASENSYSDINFDRTDFKLSIIEGNIAKPFVGHQENSVTFPLSQGQKLMLGDTLEDDGIHHKRTQTTFTGTTATLSNAKINGAYLCDQKISGNLNGQTLTFDNAVTNAIIEYELATETITPYTPAQQTAYNKLKEMQSYYDLTYITGTSNNAQPILTVQAKKSLKVINDEISNINSRLTLLEE